MFKIYSVLHNHNLDMNVVARNKKEARQIATEKTPFKIRIEQVTERKQGDGLAPYEYWLDDTVKRRNAGQ